MTSSDSESAVPAGLTRRRTRVAVVKPTLLDALAIVAVLGLALLHLDSPFGGDQFLFLIGAQKIAHHGVIYRDFWDLKQPLIYYVYALAGRLFGFTERGIHLFEALYQTIFAGVLIAVCARSFPQRWASSIVPLFTIGSYELFATNYALTSVEGLAGFPIFVSAALAAGAFAGERGTIWKALAAGCGAAIAAALKWVFLPLIVLLWAVVLVRKSRTVGVNPLRVAGLLVAGCAVPLALLAIAFAQAGVLDVALRTAFVDPPAILHALEPADRSPLWPEARAFGGMLWPLIVLALAGAWTLRRRGDALVLQMIVWMLAGSALIAVQVWSYDYRFYLIVVPIGVLAARGLGASVAALKARGRALQTAFAVLLCVMLAASAHAALRLHERWNMWSYNNRVAAASSLPFVNGPGARPGAIYIFGDPRLYYFSGRDQAVAINGWSPQLLLPRQWRDLRTQLTLAAPPYIMVENDYKPRSPAMQAFIKTAYREAFTVPDGKWYERR